MTLAIGQITSLSLPRSSTCVTYTMATQQDVPLIVSADWLKAKMDAGTGNICVLDASYSKSRDMLEEYRKCHIVGAPHFSIWHKVTATDDFPSNMPSQADFQEYVQSLGVNNDSHVVVYDNSGEGGMYYGGRAWYLFKLFGLEKVSVLDNGMEDWQAKGYPTTADIPTPKRGNFVAKRRTDIYTTFDEMEKNLESKHWQVLDSRSPHLHNGDPAVPRSGHYPGAVNVPFKQKLLDPEMGRFKTAEQLKKLFEESGIDVSKPVVASCRSGMSSCVLVMALMMAGATDCTLYHGGATEWLRKAKLENIEKS